MVSHLTPYDPVFQQRLGEMMTRMSAPQAYSAIYQVLVTQATLLAYIDNFRLLAFMCLLCTPAALLFKKVRARGAPSAMH
jgi:DHA2 family multidrug resistance protein